MSNAAWICVYSALAVFSRNALYKSTFYLLTYLLTIGEQVEAVRTEMQASVARLESELAELQQSKTDLQQDSLQQSESLERQRRENAELQQRVGTMDVC